MDMIQVLLITFLYYGRETEIETITIDVYCRNFFTAFNDNVGEI